MQSKSLKSGEVIYRIAKKCYGLWRPTGILGTERFDSTSKNFNTLYCAKSPLACFLETLQCFRPGMADLNQRLCLILDKELEDITDEERTNALSVFAEEWCKERHLLQITIDKTAEFLDVTHHETIQFLRNQPNVKSIMPLETDFDLSTVTGPRRVITQQISEIAHQSGFNGLYYTSRFGANLECYAVFDSIQIKQVQEFEIENSDEGYQEALRTFGLN